MTTVVHIFGAMDRGGAESRTLELIERIDPNEIRSIFVTLSGRPGSLAGQFEAAGAEIIPMRLSGTFPVAFLRLLRSRDVDVVHSHVATFSGALLVLARLGRIKRRIAHFRSDGPPNPPHFLKGAQYRIMRSLIGWAATDIIGVSPGALTHGWRPDWQKDPRCRVLPSGVDLARFERTTGRSPLRDLVGAGPQEKVLVHVGRGVPLKNREFAISILAVLAQDRPETWLVFVGADAPGDRVRWQQLADGFGVGQRVRFLGERSDVPQLLQGADLLILTSLYEGLPGVIVEAAAAGTPSLASELPGVKFVADHLPDIHLESLQSSGAKWAEQASRLLDSEVSARTRAAALQRIRGTIFDLSIAVPTFVALWTREEPDEVRL